MGHNLETSKLGHTKNMSRTPFSYTYE